MYKTRSEPRVGNESNTYCNESNRAIRWGCPWGIHLWYSGHTATIARKSLLLLVHVLSTCLVPCHHAPSFINPPLPPLLSWSGWATYTLHVCYSNNSLQSILGDFQEIITQSQPKNIYIISWSRNQPIYVCGQIFKFTSISPDQSGEQVANVTLLIKGE